jgi:RNA polymerase sigma factor (sigma-70 family)
LEGDFMSAALRAASMAQLTQPEPPSQTAVTPLGTRGGFDVAWATGGTGRGDAAAFEVLYRAWFERVFAFARGMTRRDEAFCLDVTQDVMLRAARSIPELNTEAELGAWFARACVSAAVDTIRREQRRGRREMNSEGRTPRGRAANDNGVEELDWLRRSIGVLSQDDQTLLMQRVGAGVTLKEAGQAVGLGEQAAHGRVRRALERLRELAREVWP